MINTGIWTLYQPAKPPVPNVLYARDAKGVDWYEFMDKFEQDTWKIEFAEDGSIGRFSKDVTSLFPVDRKIAEVAELPKDFDPLTYKFNGKKFTKIVETDEQKIAKTRKGIEKRISAVGGTISSLSVLVNAGIADEGTKAKLEEYTTYVKNVMSVDQLAPEWPLQPSM